MEIGQVGQVLTAVLVHKSPDRVRTYIKVKKQAVTFSNEGGMQARLESM